MKGALGRALLFIVISISLPVHAQLLKDIQKAVTNEAKALNTKENRDKAINAGVKACVSLRTTFWARRGMLVPKPGIIAKVGPEKGS